MIASLYRGLTVLLGPAINVYLKRRLAKGKEDPERFRERLGHASLPRPQRPLIWLHAASVGEAVSVLPLIQHLRRTRPDLTPLLTTGTVTSARLMAERLPQGALHQYVPVDRPDAVRSFLDHWKPDLALWIESEFWPNLILETHRRGTPMLLVNARMSPTSFRGWHRLPGLIGKLLDCFELCLAQSSGEAHRLERLGALKVKFVGNLKSAAAPLPADEIKLKTLTTTLDNRPRWLAASTHVGEDETVGRTHLALKARFPGLLTIVVPRHADRGGQIADDLKALGLNVAQRSRDESLATSTDIYLADTMGELGLFYRLTTIAFLGGSLIPHGGQNPLEAARLGCCALHGPHVFNFSDSIARLTGAGGARLVNDGDALTKTVAELLGDTEHCRTCAQAARRAADDNESVLNLVMEEIEPYLPALPGRASEKAPGASEASHARA